MVWSKKISPYLLLLLVVIWSRPNAIGMYTMSSESINSHSLTSIPKSADITGFNQNVTLDGNSIANITGSLLLENTTSPTMYFGKRYLLNATITVQSWGTDVDRIYDIKFILQLLDTGSNILNSLERETYTEIKALNQSVNTVVIFSISKEDIQTPEMVVAAKTVIFWKEGREPLRRDVHQIRPSIDLLTLNQRLTLSDAKNDTKLWEAIQILQQAAARLYNTEHYQTTFVAYLRKKDVHTLIPGTVGSA